MSQEDATAVELLKRTGDTVRQIEQNLERNRLDRQSLRKLLREYALRAESDGRLMNAARQESNCANRGLFLAYTHIELISWLAKNNYTIPSTSIGWYDLRQFRPRFRIPPLWASAKSRDLESLLDHTKNTAALVYADLQAYDVAIPATAIEYPSVAIAETGAPPTEAYDELISRGTLALKVLEGSVTSW